MITFTPDERKDFADWMQKQNYDPITWVKTILSDMIEEQEAFLIENVQLCLAIIDYMEHK